MKSFLDLINSCDNFPNRETHPKSHAEKVTELYFFKVRDYPDSTFGYVLPSTVDILRQNPIWEIDDTARTLTLVKGDIEEKRTKAVSEHVFALHKARAFDILETVRDEMYNVYDAGTVEKVEPDGKIGEVKKKRELVMKIDRDASPLFGIITYGSHMTVYTREGGTSNAPGEGYKFWIPRRRADKTTYGGMLDNTVAGGLSAGETPRSCIVREAQEEASIDEETCSHAVATGAITYFHIRDERAGGESGFMMPECEFTFDLDVTGLDFKPKPFDGESEDFQLLTTEEVVKALKEDQFKPNCGLVLIHFLIRHGYITPENEPDYHEIQTRLHRRFEFPTMVQMSLSQPNKV